MDELLIELYSNIIPNEALEKAFANFEKYLTEMLTDLNISSDKTIYKTYYTNRRLIFYANNLKNETRQENEEIVGPKTNAPKEEIEGFLRAFELKSIKDLEIKNDFYVFKQKNKQESSKKLLEKYISEHLYAVVSNSPDTIRWYGNDPSIQWFSPLLNILCLWNDEVVNFNFLGVNSSDKTFGNKSLEISGEKIKIKNFQDYREKLKKNFIIFDQNERLKIASDSIAKIEEQTDSFICGCDTGECNKKRLLGNISDSVEYPNISLLQFNQIFLDLPEKAIALNVTKNNKFLILRDKNTKKVINKFIIATDSPINETIKESIQSATESEFKIIKKDVDEFLSENMEIKINKLKKISQNVHIGNLYQKTKRVEDLARFVCVWIRHCNLVATESASELCKIDLISTLVRDEPDLEGSLAALYAEKNGYSQEVYIGIAEHKKPENYMDTIPFTPTGKALSIADKMDNIATIAITKVENTSSKDPYGVRKDVASIIRIILESNINIPLDLLIHRSIGLFKTALYKKNSGEKFNIKKQINVIHNYILGLFIIKFKNLLTEKDFDTNLISATISQTKSKDRKSKFDLQRIYNKIKFLKQYREESSENFNQITTVFKRINNMLVNFKETKIKNIFLEKIFKIKLDSREKAIYTKLKKYRKDLRICRKKEDYNSCIDILVEFSNLLNDYLNSTKIKTDNDKETHKRMLLLYKSKSLFDSFLDFSVLI